MTRLRWRMVLPLMGLILFAGVTFSSLRMNLRSSGRPIKYFWWGSMIILDSDPLNRRPQVPCKNGAEDCGVWNPKRMWVDPGWLEMSYGLSILPALAAGEAVAVSLGRLGISEISSFMVVTPLAIFAWHFFLGALIDYYRKRKRARHT